MYTKLYGTLLTSSIWSEDLETRVLWVTLLALADREGFIFGSPVGLARQAVLPVEAVHKALRKLMAADSESQDKQRDPERDGRRIEAGPQGGWRILNYGYYRDLSKAEDRREQVRTAVARHRARKAESGRDRPAPSPSVRRRPSSSSPSSNVSTRVYGKRGRVIKSNTADAYADAEAEADSSTTLLSGEESLSHLSPDETSRDELSRVEGKEIFDDDEEEDE